MTNSENNEKKKKGFSRRKFLVRSGLGVGVLFGVGYLTKSLWRRSIASFMDTAESPYLGEGLTPPLWFQITPENKVILQVSKIEMGQGTFTGLAQMAAEELEVDMDQIQVMSASSASGNIDGFATGGSTSIFSLYTPLRELAATMREMLKNEAAKIFEVEANTLTVKNGVVSNGSKSMTYGEISQKVSEWTIPDTPKLKERKDFKFIGKPIPRVDLLAKVKGDPIFGMDASMPDMLYGAVVRPDKIGAIYLDADISAAEGMPGVVKIVKEKDFVGVVAETRRQAHAAKDKIKATWEIDQEWQLKDITDMLLVGKGNPIVIQKEGKAKRILENEEVTLTSEYKSPIGAHAQMEPSGSVAHVKDGECTVIIPTQVVNLTRKEVAARLGFKKEKVNIIPTFLGGGFGRRLHTPNAIQAALLSQAVGRPVKCFFTRKEEFQKDTFRPPTHHVLKAKLTDDGMIEAIEHNVSSGDVAFGSPLLPSVAESILGADLGAWRGGMIQYKNIPNFRAVSWRVKLPFATSWWRSLGLLANTFAIESFMDELAMKAGKNPIDFRLAHIQDDFAGNRLKKVIQTAKEKSSYLDKAVNGRAMGFAASTDVNTPCAQVVEVSIVDDEIKVHKVTCVMDPGLVINPDQVRAQCEGSIIMGMSASMFEKMTVVDNELLPTIYGPYQMAMMRHAPREIDVILLEGSDKPGGVGEPPLGPIGAAVANAVFRLTGNRLREMPLSLT